MDSIIFNSILCGCLAALSYFVGVKVSEITITSTQVEYAQSVCKQGEWKEINKDEVICKDGGVYELENVE